MQEFEDNFDDEIDFTPPAEDTPSVQSPAEVFTLSVPNIALPAPSQFQSSVGKTFFPSVECMEAELQSHVLGARFFLYLSVFLLLLLMPHRESQARLQSLSVSLWLLKSSGRVKQLWLERWFSS